MSPVLPGPSAFRSVAGRGVDSLERALSLVPRVVDLVSEVEDIVVRVDAVVSAIEVTQQRVDAVIERTATVVDAAGALTARVSPLLQEFEPVLQRLQPLLSSIVETTDASEVAAVTEMVNLMPEVVTKFRTDILPVLDTLGTVAPDLRDMLDMTKELNSMLAAVPGLGRAKRKLDEEGDFQESYRADEEPPSSPERG